MGAGNYFSNRSPMSHFSALQIRSSVAMVVFCAAFSSRLRVGRLMPSLRAYWPCGIAPRRFRKLSASRCDKSMFIWEHSDMFTCEQECATLMAGLLNPSFN